MNRFLDKTGLELVWRQITKKFASKAYVENLVGPTYDEATETIEFPITSKVSYNESEEAIEFN